MFALRFGGPLISSAQAGARWPCEGPRPVEGVVKDPSGAVVPGVAITARNVGNGIGQKAQSNSEGGYVVSDLARRRKSIPLETRWVTRSPPDDHRSVQSVSVFKFALSLFG